MAASIEPYPQPQPLPSKTKQRPTRDSGDIRLKKAKGKQNASPPIPPTDPSPPTPWEWASLSDPSSSKTPPIFTNDGSYFFSLVGSQVKIHSVATGQVVSILTSSPPSTTETSPDSLTSAIINPHNAFQLITGSLDGRAMIWDFINATLLQTIDIGQPIHYICAHKEFKDTIFVAASRPTKKDNNAVILRVSLKPTENATEILPIGKIRSPAGLAISPNGAWIVAAAGHKVYVARTSDLASGFTKYVSPERLTCLAFHPSDEYFATGDEKGVVRLWYCLNNDLAINSRGVEKRTQTTSLHWHAHAVSSVTFTPNGAYLLSGGEEAVLVIWQVHTGKKEFIPRLGAPINAVSVSNRGTAEEYLVRLADSTHSFISSSSLRITRSYSQIRVDPSICYPPSAPISVPLAVHSSSSTLILPTSHPSSIQIYSPLSSTSTSELEVSPSNRVSRRDEKPLEPSRVESVVVSSSGLWMSTIDSRQGDANFGTEVFLKFWIWDQKTRRWLLNTRIDRPHGQKKVNDLSFSPDIGKKQPVTLLSTGEDGCIKFWVLRSRKSGSASQEDFWIARASFSFRSAMPHCASWSPDASLVAVSLGPHVAIYDPITATLCQTLIAPECQDSKLVDFIGNAGRYLAVAGLSSIVLWDLVSKTVCWHFDSPLGVCRIVSHPTEDKFVVFHETPLDDEGQRTTISVFHVSSRVPQRTCTVPFGLRNVTWYSASPTTTNFSFVGISYNWSVVVFGDKSLLRKGETTTLKELIGFSTVQGRTLFQDVFGKSAFPDAFTRTSQAPRISSEVHTESVDKADMIFEYPAYLMPSLDHLFDPLLGSFLKTSVQRANLSQEVAAGEQEEDDVDMEDPMSASITVESVGRCLNQVKLDVVTDLFRRHSICGSAGAVQPTATGQLNDIAQCRVKDIQPLSLPKSFLFKNGTRKVALLLSNSTSPSPASSVPVSSSTVTTGKKRKKSLG